MPVNETVDVVDIAARLVACVREVGLLALSMREGPIKSWTKAGSSPVSDADITVDRLLREQLSDMAPGIGWLSEESIDDRARLGVRYVWIVDPIDGTRAYLAGLPDWAVSAALVENGRPIVACLYAPAMAEEFVAVAGKGATCNGAPLAATTGPSLAGARIAGPTRFLERLAATAPPFTAMPKIHSLALRIAYVAQGTLDAAVAGNNSHDWDLAAADLLVHEAGGAFSPLSGGFVTYNRPEPRHGMLVAAGRERHATFIELLKDKRLAS